MELDDILALANQELELNKIWRGENDELIIRMTLLHRDMLKLIEIGEGLVKKGYVPDDITFFREEKLSLVERQKLMKEDRLRLDAEASRSLQRAEEINQLLGQFE